MKVKASETQIATITKALRAAGARSFREESSDPKHNAQRNLDERTHYVCDGNLRFHKARINSAFVTAGGLLFVIEESVAVDMHNIRRGHRYVVFDVFGTVVSRNDLENCKSTAKAAHKEFTAQEFDLVKHYTTAIREELKRAAEKAAALETAVAEIEAAA